MNTSQFMDKQIMDLTSSSEANISHKDREGGFIDLMNNPRHEEEDHSGVSNGSGSGIGIKKEEMVPSYDFQPIRGGLSQSLNLDSTARVWNSADNNTKSPSSPLRNYCSLDSMEPAKFILENDSDDGTLVSVIDRTMKKYTDNLVHLLESVGARITQLETRTRNLENSIDDLKVSVENNHGSTDGKMRQMENILREVQSGVIVLKDKQEIVEAELQLSKLQVPKVDQQSESQGTGHIDSVQQAASAPLQSHLKPPPPPPPPPAAVTFPQSVPPLPPPVVPAPRGPTLQQNLPPLVQLPNQFPQSQIPSVPQREAYFPPTGQTQDAPNQHYQVPTTQQQQAPPAPPPPHQPYQPAPQLQYSQPPHPPQLPSSLGHLPEETAYIPPQNYPPNIRQPPSQPPNSIPPQSYYGAPPSHMYEPPSSRSSSGFPTGYGTQSGPNEPFPYSGPPSQYGSGSTMKTQQLSLASAQSGGSGYPQLPTARVLPQALPTASVGGGSGSPGTGNSFPIDDVVEKMTGMGFSRDHVRATVRKLTESGQSVDLNVVLDKLMNDGEGQPQRGVWFGR